MAMDLFEGALKTEPLIGRMSIPRRVARARARRKFKVATVRVFSGTGVRAERGRGRQVPLKTGGYQRERELGGTPLRDVGRGPLEESRGHSITF